MQQVNVPSSNEAKSGSLESKDGEEGVGSSKLHKSDLEDVPVEVSARL